MQEMSTDSSQLEKEKMYLKRKKINLKVKQDFQIWLLGRILGTILITVGVACIIIYFYSKTVVDTDFLSHALKIRKISEILLPVLLAASMTSIVAGLLLALFLPQRIAGPIFRIEEDLQEIRNGDLTKIISLRGGDILKDLAEHANMTFASIRNMLQEVKEIRANLEVKLSDNGSEEIQKLLDEQKTSLDKFKT